MGNACRRGGGSLAGGPVDKTDKVNNDLYQALLANGVGDMYDGMVAMMDDYTMEQVTIDLLVQANGGKKKKRDTVGFKITNGDDTKFLFLPPPVVASDIIRAIIKDPRPFDDEMVPERMLLWDGAESPVELDKEFTPRIDPHEIQLVLVTRKTMRKVKGK